MIFIHHSCGRRWLDDSHGGLGLALGENNYFVSDTDYGWGPNSIGDRTDIGDWLEWFRGKNHSDYMYALVHEYEQSWSFTRPLSDPGGFNEIIMFKSCYPNSNLKGSPNDPPSQDNDLTVGFAKYVYNDLLNFFMTRPDKLFVVITAPPVQNPAYAENARAFNTWLVQDWIVENDYQEGNVAVWDFYNVLTDPDNHHRFRDGAVEYITNQGGDTLYYDSDGDNHPNSQGNQKATAEFVPMLNVFYHRWQAGRPGEPPPEGEPMLPVVPDDSPDQPGPSDEGSAPSHPSGGGLIDDFGGDIPFGTSGWEMFWDTDTDTVIECSPDTSQAASLPASMRIDFNVEANSWATCALIYNSPPGWGGSQGISLSFRASAPALIFEVNAYTGSSGNRSTYLYTVETPQGSTEGWVNLELPWENILGADWEGDAGNPVDPNQVNGIAIGFSTYPDAPNTGTIWVDDLVLMGVDDSGMSSGETDPEPEVKAPAPELLSPEEEEIKPDDDGGRRLCPSSMALGMVVLVGAVWAHRKRTQ
jgi:hypothetical protein